MMSVTTARNDCERYNLGLRISHIRSIINMKHDSPCILQDAGFSDEKDPEGSGRFLEKARRVYGQNLGGCLRFWIII